MKLALIAGIVLKKVITEVTSAVYKAASIWLWANDYQNGTVGNIKQVKTAI